MSLLSWTDPSPPLQLGPVEIRAVLNPTRSYAGAGKSDPMWLLESPPSPDVPLNRYPYAMKHHVGFFCCRAPLQSESGPDLSRFSPIIRQGKRHPALKSSAAATLYTISFVKENKVIVQISVSPT